MCRDVATVYTGNHVRNDNAIDQDHRINADCVEPVFAGDGRNHRAVSSGESSYHRTGPGRVLYLHDILPRRVRQRYPINTVQLCGDITKPEAVDRHTVLKHHQAVRLTVAIAIKCKAHRAPRLRQVGRQEAQRKTFVRIGDLDRVVAGIVKTDDATGDRILGNAVDRHTRRNTGVRRNRARGQIQHVVVGATGIRHIKRVDRVVAQNPAIVITITEQLHGVRGTCAFIEVNRIGTVSGIYSVRATASDDAVNGTAASDRVVTAVTAYRHPAGGGDGIDTIATGHDGGITQGIVCQVFDRARAPVIADGQHVSGDQCGAGRQHQSIGRRARGKRK